MSHRHIAILLITCLIRMQRCLPSTTQRCGALFGNTSCSDNSCCSQDGYCGGNVENFCNFGCQSNCNSHLNKVTQCTRPNTAALTFQGGPSDYTNNLLNVLKTHDVKATFIIYGDMVKLGRKDVLLRIFKEGHSIGSLGQRYRDFTKLTEKEMIQNLYDNEQTIKAVTGVVPKYFRPPYLAYNYNVSKAVERFQLITIMAGINTYDWKYHKDDPHEIYETVVDNLKDSSPIIMQQDVYKNSVEKVDQIIKYLKSLNYSIVNMDECLESSKYTRRFEKMLTTEPTKMSSTAPLKTSTTKPTIIRHKTGPTKKRPMTLPEIILPTLSATTKWRAKTPRPKTPTAAKMRVNSITPAIIKTPSTVLTTIKTHSAVQTTISSPTTTKMHSPVPTTIETLSSEETTTTTATIKTPPTVLTTIKTHSAVPTAISSPTTTKMHSAVPTTTTTTATIKTPSVETTTATATMKTHPTLQTHKPTSKQLGCHPYCNSPWSPITQCTQPKTVALTFDDGPSTYTIPLLDILKAHNVTATFFIYGDMIDIMDDENVTRRHILKRTYDEGHTIASHTFNHPFLTSLSEKEIIGQLENNEKIIQEVLGICPKYFRPPYLDYDTNVSKIVDQFNYINIMVGLDSNDWRYQATNPQQIYDNVVSGLNGKSPIILFHDTYNATVNLVDDVIIYLHGQGYSMLSMEECLK